jgi:hypothetical protein
MTVTRASNGRFVRREDEAPRVVHQVKSAELIGIDWRTGQHLPTSIYLSPASCGQLSQAIQEGYATVVRQLRRPWRGHTHLISWPGFGTFAGQVLLI